MAEVDFFCNYRGCRKPLLVSAWITKCSHIFCDEHGRTIPQNHLCPACNEELNENLHATYQNLNPPDIFRSMILAGLRLDVIVDIIARSMAFRAYQRAQERAYYDSTIQRLETQMTKLEAANTSDITKLQNDIVVLNKRQQQLVSELEVQRFRVQEQERILNEKNRQMQALQMKFESLRCNATFQPLPTIPEHCNQNSPIQKPPQRAFSQKPDSQLNNQAHRTTYTTQENFLWGQNQVFQNQASGRFREENFEKDAATNFGFTCVKARPRKSPNTSLF